MTGEAHPKARRQYRDPQMMASRWRNERNFEYWGQKEKEQAVPVSCLSFPPGGDSGRIRIDGA